jgi:hypothetical protein
MDAAFIEQNQIVERYLAGKLPLKGAQDFERFCRAHPELVTKLGLSERINAGLRLLDASGQPEPWAEKKLAFYQKPAVVIAAGALALVFAVASGLLLLSGQKKDQQIAKLTKLAHDQPLLPSTSTRAIVVQPSRKGPVAGSMVTIGGGNTELADFKVDVSWSTYTHYKVTIDREDQGRVGVLTNLARDSNGQLRMALNSSALGPGRYDLTLEGLDWRGTPVPQAWAAITIAR